MSACCSNVVARPSQKKATCKLIFIADGVLRNPFLLCTPKLIAEVSEKANFSLWQDAQLMVPVRESIGSKNNFLPNVIEVAGKGSLNALCEMISMMPSGRRMMQHLFIDFIASAWW